MNDQILSWLTWRQLVTYLQHDQEEIVGAPVKFPTGYSSIMTKISGLADARAKELYLQLGRSGISILGVAQDRGEHFVMWKQRGETHLFRIHETKLRAEAQKLLDGLVTDLGKQAAIKIDSDATYEKLFPPM